MWVQLYAKKEQQYGHCAVFRQSLVTISTTIFHDLSATQV